MTTCNDRVILNKPTCLDVLPGNVAIPAPSESKCASRFALDDYAVAKLIDHSDGSNSPLGKLCSAHPFAPVFRRTDIAPLNADVGLQIIAWLMNRTVKEFILVDENYRPQHHFIGHDDASGAIWESFFRGIFSHRRLAA